MKKTFYLALLWSAFFVGASAQTNIRLTETTLMHEMRATPYPKDKAVVDDRYVSFQWPLRVDANINADILDGMDAKSVRKVDKTTLHYQLRYARDKEFKIRWGITRRSSVRLLIRKPSPRCLQPILVYGCRRQAGMRLSHRQSRKQNTNGIWSVPIR